MRADEPKRYWKSLAEREGGAAYSERAAAEFDETPFAAGPLGSRRSFLQAAGFSFAGALLAGCRRAPVEKAAPWLEQPEEIIAGRSYYYTSTCGACPAGCGLLVKTRDGRPIKLEGNPDHPLSRGGLCAVGQASILGLYDSLRPKQPLLRGRAVSWQEADREVLKALAEARRSGGAVRYLSGTLTSPSRLRMIRQLLSGLPDGRHVTYDTLPAAAVLDAHERTHGVRALPHYRFDRANVVASFDADFLGTWLSPVEFTAGYSQLRKPLEQSPQMSYHVQFEARLSLTGSKADRRIRIAPEELPWYLAQLCARLEVKAQRSSGARLESLPILDDVAERLWQARGRSLVVCGAEHLDAQLLANYANELLGNYGTTLDLRRPSLQRQARPGDFAELLDEIATGRIAVLFLDGVNPVYDLPDGEQLARRLRKLPLVVSLAERLDESAEAAAVVCPDQHYLECWGDAEPVRGLFGVQQPLIPPLRGRAALESLAIWAGAPKSAADIVRETWEREIFPRCKAKEESFERFWERVLHEGWVEAEIEHPGSAFNPAPAQAALHRVTKTAAAGLTLVAYPKIALLDGRHAYNPWLQELPDPITKATWDNYACLAPATARKLGLTDGDVVRLEAGPERAVELPVLVQPGQHDNVVAVALGYGGHLTRRFANLGPRWLGWRPSVNAGGCVGENIAPLLERDGGSLRWTRSGVRLVPTGKRHALAVTQDHHTLTVPPRLAAADRGRRPIIEETTLEAFRKDPRAGAQGHPPPAEDLWPRDHTFPGHRWMMVVDLTACTGCSACVIACQVENNVPAVGKDEVRRKREMHWIRIDRYYSGPLGDVDVAFQPMMCQHCEHAPCETVCPVLATVHSSEGLNQQIYNRCIGTRYCENNCPYKVRRFNWFDYARDDRLANMVLNPDVTVRSRGVMEKCTFCVQRIQEARLEARRRGEPLRDGEVQTACQQSCPAQAIVFGDANDPASKVSQLLKSGRAYRVLEEINVRPSVTYLRLVRNRREAEEEERHG